MLNAPCMLSSFLFIYDWLGCFTKSSGNGVVWLYNMLICRLCIHLMVCVCKWNTWWASLVHVFRNSYYIECGLQHIYTWDMGILVLTIQWHGLTGLYLINALNLCHLLMGICLKDIVNFFLINFLPLLTWSRM